jgi:hypothetical protein
LREAEAPVPAEAAADDAAAEAETDDEVDIEALEKIDIESLDYGADFSAFMQKGVPQALRNRALRQLWRSNPVLANLDGLNDYDEDFNATDIILEKFESAYKIGRGYLPEPEAEAEPAEVAGSEDGDQAEASGADVAASDDDGSPDEAGDDVDKGSRQA